MALSSSYENALALDKAVLFNILLEQSSDVVYCFNVQTGHFEYISPSVMAMLGYSSEELMGFDSRSALDMVHPDDMADLRAGLARLLRTGTETLEYRQKAKQGAYRWLSNRMSLLRDTAGNPHYRIGNIRDITEKRSTELELRKSLSSLQAIFEATQESIWVFALDGSILAANATAIARLGGCAENIIGKKFQDIIPPELAKQRLVHLQEAIASAKSVEFEDERAGIRFEHHFYPVFEEAGKVHSIVSFSRDITKRIKTEAELQRASAMFESIANSTPDSIVVKDREGRMLYVNPGAQNNLCKTSEQLLGRLDTEWHSNLEEARLWMDSDRQVIEGGESRIVEERYIDARGEHVFLSTKSPLFDAAGQVSGLVGLSRDISDRKRMERDLDNAKSQAELFLDLMGHDISNMLQAILIRLELARKYLADEGRLDPGNLELINVPISVIEKATKLIGNVRALQKLRLSAASFEAIDLAPMLDGLLKTLAKASGRTTVISYKFDGPYLVKANPILKVVFENLLDNSLQHSHGPLHLAVEIQALRLTRGLYYRTTIQDNGEGIPDEKKSDVFLRQKSGTTKASGTGLGLVMVKSIVEGFGGFVEIRDRDPSDYRQGTKFLVYLRAADEESVDAK